MAALLFPSKYARLLSFIAFAEVVGIACARLQAEIFINFQIDRERLVQAHDAWSEWFLETYAAIADKMDAAQMLDEETGVEIHTLVKLTALKYSMRFLCFQIYAKR